MVKMNLRIHEVSPFSSIISLAALLIIKETTQVAMPVVITSAKRVAPGHFCMSTESLHRQQSVRWCSVDGLRKVDDVAKRHRLRKNTLFAPSVSQPVGQYFVHQNIMHQLKTKKNCSIIFEDVDSIKEVVHRCSEIKRLRDNFLVLL